MATLFPRRSVGALAALCFAAFTVTGLAGPAHAEEGYQYWNYSHLQGETWAFSEVGAADFKPEDGAVEGFRFGTSTVTQGIEPRADLSQVNFESACAGTEAATGEKRVAVLIDYGTDEGNGAPPEPRADCAAVPADASTQQVLEAVADVRVESGMTCALDGYPAAGCSTPVKNAQVPTDEETVAFALPSDTADGSGTSDTVPSEETQSAGLTWPLVGVALAVLLIAGTAVGLTRRRKAA